VPVVVHENDLRQRRNFSTSCESAGVPGFNYTTAEANSQSELVLEKGWGPGLYPSGPIPVGDAMGTTPHPGQEYGVKPGVSHPAAVSCNLEELGRSNFTFFRGDSRVHEDQEASFIRDRACSANSELAVLLDKTGPVCHDFHCFGGDGGRP